MVTILYLEDDANIQEVTQEYLLMKGYQVDLARDGNEALQLLNTKLYDIAILDIMVPFVSGLDVLTVLAQKQPDCATIILTALQDEKSQLEAFNRKADDYMIKPFSPLLLIKRIEAILRRIKANPVLEHGIVLKGECYQAYYNQVSLQLTVTEFLLLQALYQQPSRVFSREQLLDVIASDDFMVSDRVIDAHIKNLRKKLPLECIHTVIGVGYRYQESL